MADVLIRGVPLEDLDQIREAAAEQGASLQTYLRETVHARATYLRRQRALAQTAERLRGRPEVPEGERRAVIDAIAEAHTQRTDRLSDRSTP